MTSDAEGMPSDRALSEAYLARHGRGAAGEHPDEGAWEAFASGTMGTDARLRLADHVVSCASCREVYEVVRALQDEAPAFDPGAPVAAISQAEPAAWRRYTPALALAAGIVLAVAATMLYWQGSRDEVNRVATPSAPTPSAPAPPATVSVPEAPAYRLAMVKPDVQLPVDLVVATRGDAGADARRFLERFGQAITPYREGRFEDAVASLEHLTSTDGDVAEAWFYLGVSQLFAGRPADALASFDHPGVAESMGDDLFWQRAVALERIGRTGEVDTVLRLLCGRDGPYRERACAAATGGGGEPPGR